MATPKEKAEPTPEEKAEREARLASLKSDPRFADLRDLIGSEFEEREAGLLDKIKAAFSSNPNDSSESIFDRLFGKKGAK